MIGTMKQDKNKKYQTPETMVVPIATESVLLTATNESSGPSANFISNPDFEDEE